MKRSNRRKPGPVLLMARLGIKMVQLLLFYCLYVDQRCLVEQLLVSVSSDVQALLCCISCWSDFQVHKNNHYHSRLFAGLHNFTFVSPRFPTNRTISRSGFPRPLLRPQIHLGKYLTGLISVGAARRWTQQLQCSRRTTVVSPHDRNHTNIGTIDEIYSMYFSRKLCQRVWRYGAVASRANMQDEGSGTPHH